MIRSFKDRDTRRFFEARRAAAYQGFAGQAVRRLVLLDSTETFGDLVALPSNWLEALLGDRAGQHSIRINAQWRVCFCWADEGPCDVEIVDYH
ncbi:MAG: type II toxin-antitoxin system RelE/ParE family toxin [Gammaproteobacteria bacterium]|nr:type II toxin-antitoxin system RelE/ParE family toxin [Gammaproteobacteria bacterium]